MGNWLSNISEGTNTQLRTIPDDSSADIPMTVEMSDFVYKHLIGNGNTSEVYLVKMKRDLRHYAMKVIK